MIKAGLSPATAHRPAGNGYDVKRCLQSLEKVDPEFSTAKISQLAREALRRKLDDALELDKDGKRPNLKGIKLIDIARTYEITHKVDAGDDRSNLPNPKKFMDQVEWFAGVLEEWKERRSGAKAMTDSIPDAEVLEE